MNFCVQFPLTLLNFVEPSLSRAGGARDKARVFLPFSPLAWVKGQGMSFQG